MRLVPNEFSCTSLMSTVSMPSTEPDTIVCTMGCARIGSSRFKLSSVEIATSCCVYSSVVGYSPGPLVSSSVDYIPKKDAPMFTPAVSWMSAVSFVNALSTNDGRSNPLHDKHQHQATLAPSR